MPAEPMFHMELIRNGAIGRIAMEFVDGVGKGGQNGFQIFPGTPGATWKINDEGAATGAAHGSGDHGVRGSLQAVGHHGLRHARNLALDYGTRRLGGYIPGAEPCAAGGEHQVHLQPVRVMDQTFCNGFNLVGHNVPRRHLPAHGGNDPLEFAPRKVFALSPGTAVADGKNGRIIRSFTQRDDPCTSSTTTASPVCTYPPFRTRANIPSLGMTQSPTC